jgi:cytochrome P450
VRRDIPQPPGAGIVNGIRFGTDPLRFLETVQARFPDAVEVPIPGRPPLVIVTGPDLVHEALDWPEAFGRVPASGLGLPAENGLVQSEGDLWEQQRSIMLPAFVGQQVVDYGDTAGRQCRAVADELGHAADEGRTVDLHRQTTALTIRVASEILLGEDIGQERAAEFHGWMEAATEELAISPTGVLPDWVPTSSSAAYDEATTEMKRLSEEIIDRRRAATADGGEPGSDMLSLLLAAEGAPDVEYEDDQIRDEVITFLIAGHETTALSLTYTLAALSNHPEMRARVREEARAVIGDETPRYDHLEDLTYTKRVFRETLRLYPAAWAIFREATGEAPLGDYRVKDGSAMILPQFSIHRDGRYFDDPLTFDPSRWTRRSAGSADAYFPFGSGPHACIGRQFALAGATLSVAGLVRDLDIDVPADTLEEFQATITLRPGGSVPATVERAG